LPGTAGFDVSAPPRSWGAGCSALRRASGRRDGTPYSILDRHPGYYSLWPPWDALERSVFKRSECAPVGFVQALSTSWKITDGRLPYTVSLRLRSYYLALPTTTASVVCIGLPPSDEKSLRELG